MTKFNSQICTTREQSERLLELGLKKETADMFIGINWGNEIAYDNNGGYTGNLDIIIPAWSLHRIISMVYSSRAKKNGLGLAIIEYENPFEDMIRQIEWLINGGYFNKEYLV